VIFKTARLNRLTARLPVCMFWGETTHTCTVGEPQVHAVQTRKDKL
jgi:hypothetical protein